ncbi:hypothetical protein PSV08DRAFT_333352 [Bipolaris maydis]|uniref:uncharacterized protein n=1 Tax=Cochliobolus heterostrophus TaxID=5016 RepID=UPI0024D4F208|nr:hypothetical protein J3E73DRAFT_294854 [Bipolaris maydis]KAJ6266675.1 hypothetical protein PSV08DRAFT_333352 [Bipolaris maydis]KAJ6282990.1 hypothetical protein J3E71DRAFT_278463 [Bipolaris maydis]
MAPRPNAHITTLLRYTYQVNMVFFAGFAAWYFLKSPDQKVSEDSRRQSAVDDPKKKS